MVWLLTCEHYSNGIPLEYADVFINAIDVLESHRGYDIKAAPLFLRFEPLFDESIFYRYTRLLIEPNRSLDDKFLFSPFTAALSSQVKTKLIHDLYQPYRKKVQSFITDYIDQGVMHISLHTFHPIQGNEDRSSVIGINFNSNKTNERELATVWKNSIKAIDPTLSVRFNYPYHGRLDGLTTFLGKCFPANYHGFVLEVRNDCALELRKPLFESMANLRGILG
ncbi:MAG: N-formylglutamate amidohydrolase [Salibacteraceae bacterium]